MYNRILVPLDGSKLSESSLPHVRDLAKGCLVNEVVLLRVCEVPSIRADYPPARPEDWDQHYDRLTDIARQHCSLYLDDVEKQLRADGINARSDSALGDPAKEIVDYAERNQIDLIVMASHGRTGVSRWAVGSVAERVFRATCVPILMVRGPGCELGI